MGNEWKSYIVLSLAILGLIGLIVSLYIIGLIFGQALLDALSFLVLGTLLVILAFWMNREANQVEQKSEKLKEKRPEILCTENA